MENNTKELSENKSDKRNNEKRRNYKRTYKKTEKKGVNEKIEGFFQICADRGLDGSHGVIIPVQNIRNLHLNDEVVDAVKNKKFHIYAVSTIEEGIEVLTGVPAGKKDKDGHFPAGTINYLVYEKLKKYAKISNNK